MHPLFLFFYFIFLLDLPERREGGRDREELVPYPESFSPEQDRDEGILSCGRRFSYFVVVVFVYSYFLLSLFW